MNKKLILILLLFTLCSSFAIYTFYKKSNKQNYTNIYLLQVGAYKDYDNISNITQNYDNYIVRKEGDLYKVFIGVTKDEEVYNKLVSMYVQGKETFKKVLKVTNEEFETNLTTYDKIIKNTDNHKSINLVVKSGLKELEKLLNTNN